MICKAGDCKEAIPLNYIRNKVYLFLRQMIELYYEGTYMCTEPSCQLKTRQIVYNNRCVNSTCKGRVVGEFNERATNDTLRYLSGLFDCVKYRAEHPSDFSKGEEPAYE